MNQPDRTNGPHLLVVKMSSLGDLVHALPAVHNLKAELGASVDWVTQMEYVDFVRCFAEVDRVIGYPRRSFLRDGLGFVRELRRKRYDLIVDLQGLLKSAMVARLARGRRLIGPCYAREGARWLYSEVTGPMPAERRHAVEEAMDVVRHLGLKTLGPVFPTAFPSKPLGMHGVKVGLVPCSRWVTKDWPPENFVRVGKVLQQEAGATIFLIGGAGDKPVCDRIAAGLPGPVVSTCGRTTLVDMGTLLQEMDLVVGVDSGPMHVAAALGRPVVAVYCATNPRRTGPVGRNSRVITPRDLDCCPCHSRTCRRGDIACLAKIPAEEVAAAALETLAGHR